MAIEMEMECFTSVMLDSGDDCDDAEDDVDAGIYKNFTDGLVHDSLCDEVDLSQFCQHVCGSPLHISPASCLLD